MIFLRFAQFAGGFLVILTAKKSLTGKCFLLFFSIALPRPESKEKPPS